MLKIKSKKNVKNKKQQKKFFSPIQKYWVNLRLIKRLINKN